MPTIFPGEGLDNFTNPISTTKRTNLASRISDLNDAVEALESKVGVNNSVVTNSIDYLIKSPNSTALGHKHLLSSILDVTASASEVNILDGATVTTAEVNILDGVTSNTSELNILDGAIITAAELNELSGATSAGVILGSRAYHSMERQALVNGNFNIWQRNTTFTNPANAAYTADRFKVNYSFASPPGSIVHSRQSITPGDLLGSYYHYRVAPNAAGTNAAGNFYYLGQKIENGTRFLAGASKYVTVTFWAKSSISGKKIGVGLSQEYGTGGSPSATQTISGSNVTLTSSWQKITQTFTLNSIASKTFGSNNDDALTLEIWLAWGSTYQARVGASTSETFVGSGNIDIAQVQICSGQKALSFSPKAIDDEVRLCQRYYEKSYDVSTNPGTDTSTGTEHFSVGAGAAFSFGARFRTTKRTTPTVTIYPKDGSPTGSITGWNGTTETEFVITSDSAGITGFRLYGTFTGAYYNGYYHWTAEAEL